MNDHVAEPFRSILNAAPLQTIRCSCDGEYLPGEESPAMTTAGCPLHGLCQLCGERLGVKWDREPQTATSYWACLECSELCWHCAENKASHRSGCPHHPDQVAERERIEILFQEREEEETAAFERGIERGFAEAKETR